MFGCWLCTATKHSCTSLYQRFDQPTQCTRPALLRAHKSDTTTSPRALAQAVRSHTAAHNDSQFVNFQSSAQLWSVLSLTILYFLSWPRQVNGSFGLLTRRQLRLKWRGLRPGSARAPRQLESWASSFADLVGHVKSGLKRPLLVGVVWFSVYEVVIIMLLMLYQIILWWYQGMHNIIWCIYYVINWCIIVWYSVPLATCRFFPHTSSLLLW